MIKAIWTDENGKLNKLNEVEIFSPDFDINGKWIDLVNPTDKEIEYVAKLTAIPEEVIKAPLDDEERARIEFENEFNLIVFDIPIIEEERGYYSYSTLPMGYITKDNCVVTVCIKETSITLDFFMGRIKNFYSFKKSRFLFQLLYSTAKKYLVYLKQIDKASQRIQNELHKATKNKELIQLLDLENSLVYFSTSLKGNDIIISRLYNTRQMKKYEEDEELLEDVGIENKQAMEMCGIYRDILSGTMDAFASIISNNQNIVMKFLTIVTMIITIPTLIASFFGMNVPVPGTNSQLSFWFIVSVSALISLICGIILFKKKFK